MRPVHKLSAISGHYLMKKNGRRGGTKGLGGRSGRGTEPSATREGRSSAATTQLAHAHYDTTARCLSTNITAADWTRCCHCENTNAISKCSKINTRCTVLTFMPLSIKKIYSAYIPSLPFNPFRHHLKLILFLKYLNPGFETELN